MYRYRGSPFLWGWAVVLGVAAVIWKTGSGETARAVAPSLYVNRCFDFEVTGEGKAPAWSQAEWVPLAKRPQGELPYTARFKVLHSPTGLYFLMEGSDRRMTSTFEEDYSDLWKEDVFEVFLQTDTRDTVYFEYEISPRNRELPILVPNLGGKFLGWRPWHYDGGRKVRKATSVLGGEKKPGAEIRGWSAEFFIPYALLAPLRNVPPRPGTEWRANFYRVDHDGGNTTGWHWAPVGQSFHEFERFGRLVFR